MGVVVEVDPRVELMHAVWRSIEAEEFVEDIPDTPYARAVDALLADRKHPALTGAQRLRRRFGIAWNAPADLAIALDDDLALRVPLEPWPQGLDDRWDHPKALDRWLADLRDLAAEVDWTGFVETQQPGFDAIERTWRAALAREDLTGWFEDTFGQAGTVRVHPSPLAGRNNYGASLRVGAEVERHPVLGVPYEGEVARFGDWGLPVLIHEVSHGFVGPVVERHPELEGAGRAVQAHVGDAMETQAYGGWDTVVNESITRAVTHLYLRDRHPELVPYDVLVNHTKSFLWIEPLAEALDELRGGRQRPLDLDAAVPAVVEVMTSWAALPEDQRWPAFSGFVNDALGRAGVVVASPAPSPVWSYAGELHGRLFAPIGIGFAAPADATGLEQRGAVAIGSPSTNPIVADLVGRARITLAADAVTIDERRFEGAHLALIACWPHPTHPGSASTVYTAADDADVVGLFELPHGTDDWLVARKTADGFERVASGLFLRTDDGWRLPADAPRARIPAADVGLDAAALDALLARAIESRTDAIVVWKDGQTVVRWPDAQEPVETMSVTKSIVSLGIGLLVDEGRIPSLDAPASTWFPEWAEGEKAAITLRMLLEHTSGLATPLSRDIHAAPDLVAFALGQPLETPPGTKWAYNNSAANLVTAIGTRAAGEPFDDYVRTRLLEPLGALDRPWARDGAGNVHGGAGLSLTADDLVAIGRMMLDGGTWNGEPLVPEAWIRESVGPSPAADAFGRQWWVGWTGEPGDRRIAGFRADGWLGQYLVVVPEARLVAVRQMRAQPAHWDRGDEGVDTFRDFEERVFALVAP